MTENKNIHWDFKLDDPIEFFDPYMSYELTGYRPINDTEGLDFDPDWFRGPAMRKLANGKYSNTIYATPSYKAYWDQEYDYCRNGITINGYRLTGDNYFWLNYFRLKTSKEGAKASAGRDLNFPAFYVYQYEFFHYVEMCEKLGKDVALIKARALGFSEMAASLCVRPYTTTKNYRVLATAYSEKLLKPLLAKIWPQLDWLNENTEGAFKHLRMGKNTDMYKQAASKKRDGSLGGFMSEIEGVIADSPEKIRGDRTERVFFEEGGSDKVLRKKYIQAKALIEVLGGDRIGTRIVWGTGGDEGPALAGIKDIVLNPDTYNVLKYRHNHTLDGSTVLTAMFVPTYRIVKKLTDKRGWCNLEKAREYYEQERKLMANDPKALLIYKAEYCFTIDEALIRQGDNFFPREELTQQLAELEIMKTGAKIMTGDLTWETKRVNGEYENSVKWKESPNGKILIKELPLESESGLKFKNLYVGGIDSIDIGTQDSAQAATSKSESDRLSDFCIVIKKRVFGQSEPEYVAMYKDRPRDPREAYENAAKLLVLYGCQAVLEATRTAIITYFRDKKYISLLMQRPRSTMPDVTKGNSKMLGAPATIKTIEHYRELIYDFVLDYWHTLQFKEMVVQLLGYSDEKKKDFDIVAAMGMAELGDEELSMKAPRPREPESTSFLDIGYYTNEYGKKQFGIINKNKNNDRIRITDQNSWLFQDSL